MEENKGIVIAELIKKEVRKDKNNDTYWVLHLSICKKLTEMYFELRGEKTTTLPSNEKPLYVFPSKNRNRFAYTLMTEHIYLFWYSKSAKDGVDYLHIEDWRKLATDRRAVERSYRVLLNKKNGEEEEDGDLLTNQELLVELKRRMREKKIIFTLSATNSEADKEWMFIKDQIDAELKDSESSFILDLKDEEETEENKIATNEQEKVAELLKKHNIKEEK